MLLKQDIKSRKQREATARYLARKQGEDVPRLKSGPEKGYRRKPQRHGTPHEYSRRGCRCEECRTAKRINDLKYINLAANRRKQKRHKQAKIELMRQAKNKPCADCGVRYPYYVMQFDHLGDKVRGLDGRSTGQFSIPKMLAEIAKCEVVCANCHMERTHRRKIARNADAPQIINASHLFQKAA